MKRTFLVLLSLLIIILTFSQTSYDLGFSVLNDESGFNFALRFGLESNVFNFSFDMSPKFGENFELISITDVSAKIWDINEYLFLDVGLLWLNDAAYRGNFLYSGINANFQNILAKFYVGYPFQRGENFLDYFVLKVGYTVPKPVDFIDDLKMELRLVNGRIDFSVFLVEPI